MASRRFERAGGEAEIPRRPVFEIACLTELGHALPCLISPSVRFANVWRVGRAADMLEAAVLFERGDMVRRRWRVEILELYHSYNHLQLQ